jgi:hypothetical protein
MLAQIYWNNGHQQPEVAAAAAAGADLHLYLFFGGERLCYFIKSLRCSFILVST